MLDTKPITQYLGTLHDYFVSDVSVRSSDGVIVLYVPNEKVSEKLERGFVSKIQLENLAKKLSVKFGVGTEIIYVHSEKLDKIAQGVELLLRTQFDDLIEEVIFTFLSAKKVNTWLKVNWVDKDQAESIKTFLNSIFADSGVDYVEIQWVDEHDRLPTLMELLVLTKTIQPAGLDKYLLRRSDEYKSVDRSWLNKQLDKLIKKGLVVRDRSSQEYSLTGKGLGAIPGSFSRTSSDITRALDLGRRKWQK